MPAFRLTSSQLAADEQGATLIEMSVVIPVLLAIGLGTLEFGNLFYKYHLIANAVRDAARYAAGLNGTVLGSSGDVCTSPKAADLQKMAADLAQQTGAGSEVWTSGTIAVSCASFDNSADEFRGADSIYSVKVTATVPYQSLGFLGYFNLASPTLTVSHQERVIGGR